MQQRKTEELCEQASKVTFLFHGFKDLQHRLNELDADWVPEVDEYLREETYAGRNAHELIREMRGAVSELKTLTAHLMSNHIDLCLDLERVDRGESFSV